MQIVFNKPLIIGNESDFLKDVIHSGNFSGDSIFPKLCSEFLGKLTNTEKVFMTSSASAALQMCALLLDIESDDEIILPAFTHISTANAFAMFGAKLIWAEIREDTKNIDEELLENLVTENTKAIVIIHYAGISCEIKRIVELCKKHNIFLIEDASHCIDSYYENQHIGTFGDFGIISFHETKNVHCGEGGALLINNEKFKKRAEIIYERGTNRKDFILKKIDAWTWIDVGSNFFLSGIQAAFLFSQLQKLNEITKRRKEIFELYYLLLSEFLQKSQLPGFIEKSVNNGHIFYLITSDRKERDELFTFLKRKSIQAVFHFQPLHLSDFALKKGFSAVLPITEKVCDQLVRLPIYYDLSDGEVIHIVDCIKDFYRKKKR